MGLKDRVDAVREILVVAFLLWFVVGAALFHSVPLFALFVCLTYAGLIYWATTAPSKPTGIGYSGTLRIEDGLLHGGDSVLELADMSDVHIHSAEDGITGNEGAAASKR